MIEAGVNVGQPASIVHPHNMLGRQYQVFKDHAEAFDRIHLVCTCYTLEAALAVASAILSTHVSLPPIITIRVIDVT